MIAVAGAMVLATVPVAAAVPAVDEPNDVRAVQGADGVRARTTTDPGAAAWERVPRERVAEECGLDPDLMEQADALLAPRPYAIVRYGKLCWEARGTDEVYHVASITKTMGALMVGLAATRTTLSDTDPIDRWVDPSDWPLVNPEATLANALSMNAYNPVLAYPLKQWMYDILGDREIDLLMGAVDAVLAEQPQAFPGVSDRVGLVQSELFDRLGMASSSWEGETIGFSMESTVRDMARMGLLIGRRGVYGGERLIDAEYMYRMTHPTFEDANTGYGYLTYNNADLGWFYSTGTADPVCSPVAVWPHYPHRPFFEAANDHGGAATRTDMVYDIGVNWAAGAGGQRITTHRGLDLVMVIRDEATNEGHKSVWNAIRPALVALDPVYQGDEAAFCEAYRSSRYAPDLLPDLTVATPTLRISAAGDEVALSAVVTNIGEQHASDVTVRFTLDGAPVAETQLEEVQRGDSVLAEAAGWAAAGPGHHTVEVHVDPDGRIPQTGAGQRTASATFSLSDAHGSGAVERFAGPSRIETAVAVAGRGLYRADTVVIARADDPADALAGAPLAAHLGAPLLLSAGDHLSPATAREVRRLGATEAVLLGGTAALSEQVAADLQRVEVEVARVRRVAGANRHATAAAIAEELPATDELFIVRSDSAGFPDAVSVSGLAASLQQPILLSASDALPPETAEVIDAATSVVVVGGTAAVSAAVEAELAERARGVRRLAGGDRYATSSAVARDALTRGPAPEVVWVATGAAYPDALVAGPAAARDAALLLLVDGTDLDRSAATRDVMTDLRPRTVRVAGGTTAISHRVAEQLLSHLR
jgi:putative cell wall-binding protein